MAKSKSGGTRTYIRGRVGSDVLTHVDNIERQLIQRSHHENQLLVVFICLFKAQNSPTHQGVRIELV